MVNTQRITNLTIDELRAIIREEIEHAAQLAPKQDKNEARPNDLSDFPLDDLGSWPQGLTLRRDEIYDDNGR